MCASTSTQNALTRARGRCPWTNGSAFKGAPFAVTARAADLFADEPAEPPRRSGRARKANTSYKQDDAGDDDEDDDEEEDEKPKKKKGKSKKKMHDDDDEDF